MLRRQVLFSASLRSAVLALQHLRKSHKRIPCSKSDAPAESRGFWRKYTQAQEVVQGYFYSLIENWANKKMRVVLGPTSQLPEERDFVVD